MKAVKPEFGPAFGPELGHKIVAALGYPAKIIVFDQLIAGMRAGNDHERKGFQLGFVRYIAACKNLSEMFTQKPGKSITDFLGLADRISGVTRDRGGR